MRVLDPLPADVLGATWTCTAPAGPACAPPTKNGDVDVVVDLLPGANTTITVDATLDQDAAGTLSNAATLVVRHFTSLGPLPAPVDVAEIDHVSDLVVTKDDHTDSVTADERPRPDQSSRKGILRAVRPGRCRGQCQ